MARNYPEREAEDPTVVRAGELALVPIAEDGRSEDLESKGYKKGWAMRKSSNTKRYRK